MDLRSHETQGKSSLVRHRDRNEGSSDHRPSKGPVKRSPQDEKRPFRRVRSPSRPRAGLSGPFKPRFGGRFYRPRFLRDEHPFRKPGFGYGFGFQRYHHFTPRPWYHWRDQHRPHPPAPPPTPSCQHSSEPRSPPAKPKEHTSTPSRSSAGSSSREKEKPSLSFTVSQENEGAQVRERERGRERDLTSTLGRAAARNGAIQEKRREIEEVYRQDSDTFGAVVRMLIAKDPSLERPIQSSLQENLSEIGLRCVEAMQHFIDDYDSKDPSPK